jgi:hypothetical protein
MMRRCAGVYSSSAEGTFGMMLMIPPDTLNSTVSPALKPAWRCTSVGTVSPVLFFPTAVIRRKIKGSAGSIADVLGPSDADSRLFQSARFRNLSSAGEAQMRLPTHQGRRQRLHDGREFKGGAFALGRPILHGHPVGDVKRLEPVQGLYGGAHLLIGLTPLTLSAATCSGLEHAFQDSASSEISETLDLASK